MSWFYTDKAKKRIGPVSEETLQKAIKNGIVGEKSYVWNGKDVPEWIFATKVPRLEKYFKKDVLLNLSKENDFFDQFSLSSSSLRTSRELINMGDGEQMIEIVNRLRDLGAHMEVDLPVICLCGQQSCGKSSVSESISGIPLPRADGTCTRCPTEVRMVQQNGKWSASVSVRFEWDDLRNKPLTNPTEKQIGSTSQVINVERLVAKAQSTILAKGLKFSRNLVVVNIQGPSCKNLTIVDLPGLIFATATTADEKYIGLVRELVESYIQKNNTLIAAVVSAKDDMENQMINTLVRKYDPNGLRTLGIITKLDTIESGLENKWLEIVEGERYALKLGYCLVKNPSQHELSLRKSYDEYRNDEANFFKKHPVWNNLPSHAEERLGSENVVRLMSGTLADIIKIQLPKIKRRVTERVTKLQEELVKLPPKPAMRGSHKDTIMCHILEFVDDVKQVVRSSGGDFWVDTMKVFSTFFKQLEDCKPRFHKQSTSKKTNRYNVESFSIQEVMKTSEEQASRALQFTANPRARAYFLQVSMKPWASLTQVTISNNISVLNKTLLALANKHFGQYPRAFRAVKTKYEQLITKKHVELERECAKLQKRETFEFTLSKANLRHVYNQAFQQLSELFAEEAQQQVQTLVASGRGYLVEEAIMVMAESLSYYDLSYRRYGDVAAMAIEHTLFREFSEQIHNFLFQEMNILTNPNPKYFEDLMQTGNSPLLQKRDIVEKKINKLNAILDELQLVPITNFDLLNTMEEQSNSFGDVFNFEKQQDVPKKNASVAAAPPKTITKKEKKRGWFG